MRRGGSDAALLSILLLLSKKLVFDLSRADFGWPITGLSFTLPKNPLLPKLSSQQDFHGKGHQQAHVLRRALQSPRSSPNVTGRRSWRMDGYWREDETSCEREQACGC